MLNITRGIVARPQKVVIYGPEGIGKTTLASKTPDPLFIDTEGGSAHLDVRRIEGLKDWEELISTIREVAVTKDICKTLVLDTADWAEQLAIAHILKTYNQKSIEAFGYGKGYTYIGEEFTRLLDALDMVIAGGMNVVVTAHAKMRKFEQPDEMGAYDRWEMKLTRQSAPLLKEWCDLLLFCNYEIFVVSTENKTAKAQGGKRVMYTSHHPCWDAKNRHGLPDKLDLDYRYLKPIFALPTGKEQQNEPPEAKAPDQLAEASEPAAEQQQTEAPAAGKLTDPATSAGRPDGSAAVAPSLPKVRELLQKDGISEDALRKFVASKGHYEENVPLSDYSEKFLSGWILKYWPKIREMIRNTNTENTKVNKEDRKNV
jgi:GTPase SAR1 family protein